MSWTVSWMKNNFSHKFRFAEWLKGIDSDCITTKILYKSECFSWIQSHTVWMRSFLSFLVSFLSSYSCGICDSLNQFQALFFISKYWKSRSSVVGAKHQGILWRIANVARMSTMRRQLLHNLSIVRRVFSQINEENSWIFCSFFHSN